MDIEALKNEIRNYSAYLNELARLTTEKSHIFYELTGVKSPRLDRVGGRGNPESIANRQQYLRKRLETIEKEIRRVRLNINYIESLLIELPEDIEEIVRSVYIQKMTFNEIAKAKGKESHQLKYLVNEALKNLVENHF